jgi:hypothetical protein
MKARPLFLTFVAAVVFAGGAFGESAQQLLTAAQVAYQKGDYEAAKRDFEMVLRIDPRNTTANGFMRLINAQQAKDGGGAATEKALAQLIVPQIQFKDATLGSALEFMKKKAAELSGGKQAVNFVVQPGIDQTGTVVTVNLTNIPFTEALRYVGELANITFQYQKYAIVVKPRGAVATNAPAPSTGKAADQ